MEQAPELTHEDEKLLDKVWASVAAWKPAHVSNVEQKDTVRLGWGLNK